VRTDSPRAIGGALGARLDPGGPANSKESMRSTRRDVARRERVLRISVVIVAAAYLVVGWLAIEVAATVAPQLDLPDWVPRLITFVPLLAFP